jgi:peptidoglycan/LPS O-acetylase OafA/YrhL
MQRVLLLFPLIILAGAHSEAATGMMRLCKFSGKLSFPLYITHIPFVYDISNFAHTRHPSQTVLLSWIFLIPPFAMLALKCWDEPVRTGLTLPLQQQTGSAAIVNPNGRGWRMKECKLVSKPKRSQLGQRSDGQRTWVQ